MTPAPASNLAACRWRARRGLHRGSESGGRVRARCNSSSARLCDRGDAEIIRRSGDSQFDLVALLPPNQLLAKRRLRSDHQHFAPVQCHFGSASARGNEIKTPLTFAGHFHESSEVDLITWTEVAQRK